ncbi:restriction endonuclease subunit S [Kocuria tytonicola]|uniref:restriction endonuclease subunit S n=1 Tax=Kocuria tytonicola TaxID=2055946 RepID=UPI000F51A2FE|nr:restriction endonuclease subunit S [Kocuria tytonicola]
MTATEFNATIENLASYRGWSTSPLKFVFQRSKQLGTGSEQLLSIYRDHGVIPKDSRSDNFNKASDDLSKYQRVDAGDLVVNKMKAWQGSVAVSGHAGIISPAYFIYKSIPTVDANSRYLHYLLRSELYFQHYGSISTGVRPNQWDLNPIAFERTVLLYPPSTDQERIADYLDHETVEIDALIEELSQLGLILQERLNSNRDRLVWEASRGRTTQLRHALLGLRDGTHGTHARITVGGVPLLSAKNISPGKLVITDEESCISETEASELTKSGFPSCGDILLIVVGATIGRAAHYSLPQRLPFQRSVAFLRPNTKLLTSEFLLHSIRSRFFQDQLHMRSKTAAQPGVYLGDVGSCEIHLPDMDYQVEVSHELENLQRRTDEVSKGITKAISLAKERRAAIITAAVTGQIDVTARNKPAAEQLEDDIAQGLHREN